MITKHSIENLKNQIDIVDIISNSLELKKAGANFNACCPFHGEDTPSFVVSPVKQIYHCFGCGVGGDAISFIQEYHKLSYPEALEYIANDLNFTLEYDNSKEKKDYKNIIESINHYYINNLKDQELDYLFNRGVTKESIAKFEIGFARSSKKQIEHLKNNFLNIQDAQDIGILSMGDNGLYSRLINRITFPIRNHTNKLIGFGGRTTTGHSAKYVNSIQTKLFDKSRNLYGLNIAKEHIYKKGTIVITEGYLDVVMMHQAGIKTAVATMGTALTEQHMPIIKKMNCKVLLCYDGDNAGRVAAYKASVLLSRHLIDGSVVIFDDGVDPADMVKDGKQKELISLMLHGTPLIQYALSHIALQFDISNPLQKDKAKKECINFLNSLKNEVVASEYLGYIAHILQIDIKYIHLNNTNTPSPRPAVINDSINANLELSIIATALEDFNPLNLVMTHCKTDMFTTYQNELNKVINCEDIDSLDWVSLKDGVVVYSEDEFKKQLCIFLADYYERQIKSIKASKNLDTINKINKIKEVQKKILNYKQGRV